MSVIAIAALPVPEVFAFALKVMLMVQLPPAGTLEPQVFVCEKFPVDEFVIAILVMLSATPPGFVRVITCGALVVLAS